MIKIYRLDIPRYYEICNEINYGPEETGTCTPRAKMISLAQFEAYIDQSKLFKFYVDYHDIVPPHFDNYDRNEYLDYRRQGFFYNLEVSEDLTGFPILWFEGPGTVTWNIDAKLDVIEIYEELYAWSKSIGANFYYDNYRKESLMTDEFLEKLRIKLGSKKISGEKVLSHTIDPIGRFMAIQAGDDSAVLDFLKKKMSKSVSKSLTVSQRPWDQAFSAPQEDEIIITPSIGGWVFASGLLLNRILPISNIENETKAFLDGINQLSKKFKKSRWFEYSPDYNLLAYIKSDKGEIKYGVIQSEEENRIIGTKPRELGKEENPDINFIASKWALDPDTFLYMPVLKNAQVTILKLSGGLFY